MKDTGKEKKKGNRYGIAVAGSIISDIFYKIDAYPKEGFLAEIRASEGHAGGTGNIIQDLAKLDPGMPIEVCGIIGEDEQAKVFLDEVSSYSNVCLDMVKREGETSVTLVMNAQDTKQRTFFFLPAASDQFGMDDVDWDNLHASVFLLEYVLALAKADQEDEEYGTHGARMLHEAKRQGMYTAIDAVSKQGAQASKVIACALRYTDYCSINELEAEEATGIDLTSTKAALAAGAETALRKLQALGVSKWAVIHSSKCSYGLDCESGLFYAVPSLELPEGFIKGSNGAGDAFCAGILYAAQRGDRLEEALKLASACAACSLSEENGSDGMRSYGEVLELAKEYGMEIRPEK